MAVTSRDIAAGLLTNMGHDPAIVSLDTLLNANAELKREVAELKLALDALAERVGEIEDTA
jgi:hypothetical protein